MVILVDVDNCCQKWVIKVKFIFIGVGGVVLILLQEIGILQVKEYVGFLVGGQFLVCENLEVVNYYLVKVYGQVEVGVLLMLVLYIDICIIDGKCVVLFGLFVIFLICFLKNGLLWDLLVLMNILNILLMFNVGLDNFDLVKYLISQVMQKDKDCLVVLCEYYLEVWKEDWWLWQVGQCVQIIKCDVKKGGVLCLGIEVVSDDEGIVVVFFGVLSGVFIVVFIMLQLMEKVFKDKVNLLEWQVKLKVIILIYGICFDGNLVEIEKVLVWISEVLELKYELVGVVDEVLQVELKLLSGGKLMVDIVF